MKTTGISKVMSFYLQFLLAQQMQMGSSNVPCFMKVSFSHDKFPVSIFIVQVMYRPGLKL